MEMDVELLHPIIYHLHLVITHHPDKINRPKGSILNLAKLRKAKKVDQKQLQSAEKQGVEQNREEMYSQLHEIHFPPLAWGRHDCCLLLPPLPLSLSFSPGASFQEEARTGGGLVWYGSTTQD